MSRRQPISVARVSRRAAASLPRGRRWLTPIAALCAVLALNGCAVVMVAGAAASVATTAVGVGVSAVGLAADAAVGTARLGGKAVGAMLPDSDKP